MAYTQADLWRTVDQVKTLSDSYGRGHTHEKNVQVAIQVLTGQRTMTNVRDTMKSLAAGRWPGQPAASPAGPQPAAQPTAPPPQQPPPAAALPTTPPRDYYSEARILFPWIPEQLLNVYAGAWQQYGTADLALQVMRQDGSYEQHFAGNRRDDGSVRLPEAEYLAVKEGYRRETAALGLDPSRFEERYTQAIINGRSVDEFSDGITSFAAGILSRGDSIRSFYATTYGTGDLSDTALIDSALTGESPLVIERRIRSAQIGGEAAGYGFSIARQQAERLEMLGLDQQAARGLFSKAQQDLPTLGQLFARHNDPDDDFTLDEYTDAVVLQDADQLAKIRRVHGQERSLFSSASLLAADQAGRTVGLRER